MSSRMRTVVIWAVLGLLALLGGRAFAADYETCFAFDPAFLQRDRRAAEAVETAHLARDIQDKDTSAAPEAEAESGETPVELSFDALEGLLE